jgi:hypothetical protein
MSRAPGTLRRAGEPLVIAFVLSAGHSGSTLLSLLLNAHSQIHALSEIDELGRFARDPQRGRRPLESPFWRAVRARYEAASGRPFAAIELRRARRASPAERETIARDYRELALAVAIVSGKRILVDASKAAARLELLLGAVRLELRVIQLLRDGRGVLSSYRRKDGSAVRGFRDWSRGLRAAARLRERWPATPWLELRYEELAVAPERELRRACDFLGVAFEPAMLHFRRAAWEGISGNCIAHGHDERIQLDDRWRQDLPRLQRALFHLLGSRLNARHGY